MYWRILLNNISLQVVFVRELGLLNKEYSCIDYVYQGNYSYDEGYRCTSLCFKLRVLIVSEPQRLTEPINLSEVIIAESS